MYHLTGSRARKTNMFIGVLYPDQFIRAHTIEKRDAHDVRIGAEVPPSVV